MTITQVVFHVSAYSSPIPASASNSCHLLFCPNSHSKDPFHLHCLADQVDLVGLIDPLDLADQVDPVGLIDPLGLADHVDLVGPVDPWGLVLR